MRKKQAQLLYRAELLYNEKMKKASWKDCQTKNAQLSVFLFL